MISFASPFYLLLMPLAAGPVVLHFLSRYKMKRQDFSSIFFLRSLRQRRFRWLRLRDLLLLLLRTLFLIFLILALAGPVWKGRFPLVKTKADVVMIADDSYSTAARFDKIKASAQRILDELSQGSRVVLLTLEKPDTLWQKPEETRQKLEGIRPSFYAYDLEGLWERAVKFIQSSQASERRIIIISDGQSRALDFLKKTAVPQDIEVYCFVESLQAPENTSIIETQVSPRFPMSGEEQFLRVRLRRHGEVVSTSLDFTADGRVLGEREISLGKEGERLEVTLPADAKRIEVTLNNDSIPADDQRFVLSGEGEGLRVALVGDANSRFLELALRSAPGTSLEKVTPPAAARVSAAVYDLLIWDGADSLPSQAQAAARRGVPVLVLLSPDAQNVEGVFGSHGKGGGEGFDVMTSSEMVSDFSASDLERMRFSNYARLEPIGSQVLLSLKGGEPLMFVDTLNRIYYFTTRFIPEYTNLVYQALFPALVQRMAAYSAGESNRSTKVVGDTLEVILPSSEPVVVKTPRIHYEIVPRPRYSVFVAEFARTSIPGFYQVGPREFAVNVDSRESSPAKIDVAKLETRGIKVYSLEVSTPRKLWLPLLIMAALFLAAEMGLLAAGYVRKKTSHG